jgi:hypothetical protein
MDKVARRASGDGGTGLIGTVAGVMVFFAFLFFAVQLLVALYYRSAVTAAAYEAAHAAAGRDARRDVAALDRYASHARAILGRYGSEVDFSWQVEDVDDDGRADEVALTVHAAAPRILGGPGAAALGLAAIDRTVHVRVERWR